MPIKFQTLWAVNTCAACGQTFYPKKAHHNQCYPCWEKTNPFTEKHTTDLELQISWLRHSLEQEQREREHWQHMAASYQQRLKQCHQKLQPNPAIPPDLLRCLIQLCHPDRHENSETATKATAWLLQHRSKFGQGVT